MTSEPVLNACLLFGFVLCVGLVVFVVLNTRAAYRNGVVDGYGFSKEPTCPGYAQAGDYLRQHMAHRWPELTCPVHCRCRLVPPQGGSGTAPPKPNG